MNCRIPFHFGPGRSLGHPVRAILVQDGDRFEVIHEPGQVLEVAPEPIDLLRRTPDDDALLHLDPLAPMDAGHGTDPIAPCAVPAQGPVHGTTPGYGPGEQAAR